MSALLTKGVVPWQVLTAQLLQKYSSKHARMSASDAVTERAYIASSSDNKKKKKTKMKTVVGTVTKKGHYRGGCYK